LYDIKNQNIISVDKNDIMDKIYYQECRLPTDEELKKYKKHITSHDVKIQISKIEEKVPLYDIYTENLYLIGKHNVYTRVTHQSYRFPEQSLLDSFSSNASVNTPVDVLELRKSRKINLMLEFMNNFDIDTLHDTYIKVFHKYSEFVGKETTVCKNPSFMPQFYHVKPYLSRSEIINLTLNFNITFSRDTYLEQTDVMKLCKQIRTYQITSNVLLEHQNYIINNENLGLVQFYTLQGSFFMNQYLRDRTSYKNKNEYLESLIKPMWKLVNNSPEFDKSYIVYRFVQEDSYLRGLNIGDMFVEKGFMSTTRDPFYRSDLYKFGFILIKIKIPAGTKGIALCLETVSHFPEEQELIFPPNTHFKLVNRDENCAYYHTDTQFSSKVKTRYEFEWVKNSGDNYIFQRDKLSTEIKDNIDFLKIQKSSAITLEEKLKYFETNFVDKMYQFQLKIGEHNFTLVTEWYDSTGAYKHFYALETKNGYSIYTMYKGYMLFFIEIGETIDGIQMHINYYVKYSSIDTNKVIGDENMIKFFSSVAHYFNISIVVMYANYLNCDNQTICQHGGISQRGFAEHKSKQQKNQNAPTIMGGSYCVDFYEYLDNKTKKYADIGLLNMELMPKFSYYDLDILHKTSPLKVLNKTDRDELYQLYEKSFKLSTDFVDTIAKFYVWLKNNKCYLLDQFVRKIDRLIEIKNPFRNDMYVLDPSTYLYNRKYIKNYPTSMVINTSIKRNVLRENKNEYRIES